MFWTCTAAAMYGGLGRLAVLVALLVTCACASVHLQNTASNGQTEALAGPCWTALHEGWRACRLAADTHPRNLSRAGAGLPGSCIDAVVPGTVLGTLLANGTYADPFWEDNLRHIPDISQAGRAFYTFVFVRDLQPAFPSCSTDTQHTVLHLRASSYTVHVWANGKRLHTVLGDRTGQGSFLRHTFPLPPQKHGQALRVAILVEPPPYPGRNDSGQGGDHEIAKNAAVMQFTAGWDWIQATPDRNTGLWDRVWLETNGAVTVHDPYVQTIRADPKKKTATVRILVDLQSSGEEVAGNVKLTLGALLNISKEVTMRANEQLTVDLGTHDVIGVDLWWPHTHGTPTTYPVDVYFERKGGAVTHRMHFRAGLRTVRTWVDESTQGRVFEVNGVAVFLVGGNWIATDQFLRHTASAQRYFHEVRMHREAGLNLIRVWGGGLAERPEFYEACDRLGMLVMQEFWMTGDNNGRWAGHSQWPHNHDLFVRCAADTLRMLRRHPSLLFWCGGNELHPAGKSPPPDVLLRLQAAVRDHVPGAFFIASSMGNYTDWDPRDSLAPKDGPYGILPPAEFFTRNPGLHFWNKTRADSLAVGFNPELGSVSTPVVESMRKFLSPATLASLPPPQANDTQAHPLWVYHKYIAYAADGYDHIYAYGPPASIEEYCVRAQLVQYAQYRGLFEGYLDGMWRWYTAVAMWKTQSPWPALRGGLYDPWLEYTGGLWGVRAALHDLLHVQMNVRTQTVTVVNRASTAFTGGHVDVSVYALASATLLHTARLPVGAVGPSSVCRDVGAVAWPSELAGDNSTVVLVVLALYGKVQAAPLSRNIYWQTNPAAPTKDLSSMAAIRATRPVQLTAKATGQTVEGGTQVGLVLHNRGPGIAFMVRLSVMAYDWVAGAMPSPHRAHSVHPVWYSSNFLTLLPGERASVDLQVEGWDGNGRLAVGMDGWNTAPLWVYVFFDE